MGRIASKGIIWVLAAVFALGGGAAIAKFFNQPDIAIYLDKQRDGVVASYNVSGTVVEVSATAQ